MPVLPGARTEQSSCASRFSRRCASPFSAPFALARSAETCELFFGNLKTGRELRHLNATATAAMLLSCGFNQVLAPPFDVLNIDPAIAKAPSQSCWSFTGGGSP